MGKPYEVEFLVKSWAAASEFGVFWWSERMDLKEVFILDLEGDFSFDRINSSGSIQFTTIKNTEWESIRFPEVGVSFDEKRKSINIGTVRVDPKNPNALITVSEAFLNNLQSLLISGSNEILIKITTLETVLFVREIASISLTVTPKPKEVEKKKGLFW
jgi:hypothetical protein